MPSPTASTPTSRSHAFHSPFESSNVCSQPLRSPQLAFINPLLHFSFETAEPLLGVSRDGAPLMETALRTGSCDRTQGALKAPRTEHLRATRASEQLQQSEAFVAVETNDIDGSSPALPAKIARKM